LAGSRPEEDFPAFYFSEWFLMKLSTKWLAATVWRPAIIVFLLSALPKVIFGLFFFADSRLVISDPDSTSYFRLAENLRQHGLFSRSEQPPLIPDNVLTPVYPLVLAALLALSGGSLWIVPLAQGLINSLTAVLVFKTGEQLFGARAGVIAGICWGLDLSALTYSFSMLTESLFTFLFFSATFLLVKFFKTPSSKFLILSATLLGIATLCRPVASYFAALAALLIFFTGQREIKTRSRKAVLYLTVYALVITPWILRNKLMFGVANLSAIQGINLLLVNTAYLKAVQENLDYATASRLLEAEADSLLAAQGFSFTKINLEYEGRQPGQLNEAQHAQFYQQLAVKKILSSPLLYARIHLAGIQPSFLDTNVRDLYFFSDKERPMLGLRDLLVTQGPIVTLKKFWSQVEAGYLTLYLFNAGWLAFHYLCALIAVYQLIKQRNLTLLWLMLLPLVYLIFVTAPAGSARFRFPVMPYIYILSGLVISQITRRVPQNTRNVVSSNQQ
jgi:4-amino-4-deoxy-L-arabinose transferase-like glycosyltransferase